MNPGPPDPDFEVLTARPHTLPPKKLKGVFYIRKLSSRQLEPTKRNGHVCNKTHDTITHKKMEKFIPQT